MTTATDHSDVEHLRREALTMGLYACITLLAALSVTRRNEAPLIDVFGIIWGTTVGLALAHWAAFGLAVRLMDPDPDGHVVNRQLFAQLSGAAAVAVVATTAVLLLPESAELAGARFATALCVGGAALGTTRAYGGSWGRALRMAGIALVIALTAAGIEHALTH